MLAQIENADDVFVRNIASENQLLFEALQNCRISSQLRPDHLERDQPVKFAVASLIDRAHSALAKHSQDFIAPAKQDARLQSLKRGDTRNTGAGSYRLLLPYVWHRLSGARNRRAMR